MLERIKKLCAANGMNVNQLENKLGFSIGTIGHWKESVPKADKLLMVADELNVSPEYLLWGKEKTPATDADDGRYGLSSAQWKQIGSLFNAWLAAHAKAAGYLAVPETGLTESEAEAFVCGDYYVSKAQMRAIAERLGVKTEDIILGYARAFDGPEDSDIRKVEWLLRSARVFPSEDLDRLIDYAHILAVSRGLHVEEPPKCV